MSARAVTTVVRKGELIAKGIIECDFPKGGTLDGVPIGEGCCVLRMTEVPASAVAHRSGGMKRRLGDLVKDARKSGSEIMHPFKTECVTGCNKRHAVNEELGARKQAPVTFFFGFDDAAT